EKGQSGLKVVLDLDGRVFRFLQQVFPEQSPSEIVLHQLTSECSHHSLYPDNTVEYVVARMQRERSEKTQGRFGPRWGAPSVPSASFSQTVPSEMILHQLTSECLRHSLYPDNTVEYVIARMQSQSCQA
nr:hypothetical protein [Tanacetum cinerariifolium]